MQSMIEFRKKKFIRNEIKKKLCNLFKGYPSYNPIISSFSTEEAIYNKYTVVYVNGYNFLPNNTFVYFGSIKISVNYYSSLSLSFVVPSGLPRGEYTVYLINVYNNAFCSGVKQITPGVSNMSNFISFQII